MGRDPTSYQTTRKFPHRARRCVPVRSPRFFVKLATVCFVYERVELLRLDPTLHILVASINLRVVDVYSIDGNKLDELKRPGIKS
jgi:hypothetical protein